MSALLDVRELSFSYSKSPLIQQVSFALERGDIACLLGPSGCGKTTLQRLIAGFEQPDAGEIVLNGQRVADAAQSQPPERRQIGMVFQDNALFPHLTVSGNIAFGLNRWSRSERESRVSELLALCELTGHANAYPHEISGGQQQRVALARALAPRPELILLDEPFSGADASLRQSLADEVRRVIRAEGMSAIMVTHDQTEAFAMADQIGLMSQGRLQQWDTAQGLYTQPANRFVAEFIGEGGLIRGTLESEQCVSTSLGTLTIEPLESCPTGSAVDVLLRPEHLTLSASDDGLANVSESWFQGRDFEVLLELPDGQQLRTRTSDPQLACQGQALNITAHANPLMAFRAKETESDNDN